MCDQEQVRRWASDRLTRRGFGGAALAVGAGACAPKTADSADMADADGGLSESMVTIPTAAGTMDGFYVHPTKGKNKPVLIWPDIAGLRESKREMARRLAGEGYAVLVANPYYRDVKGEQFADFADFAGNGGWEKVTPWRSRLDAEAIQSDARAVAAWFGKQDAVDQSAGIGTQGYCMGGPFTVWSVAAHEHFQAAASFHGGGLVRDGTMSPHRMLRGNAHYLIAVARNDDAKDPESKTVFREAADAAGSNAEIEVYAADHGWCVPDSPSYDRAEAERAWGRLLAIYSEAL